MTDYKTLGLCSLFMLAACGPADKIPEFADLKAIELFDEKDLKVFTELPLEGSVEKGQKFWSDSIWPFNQGAINYRWNSYYPTGLELTSPTKEELSTWSQEQISELSPSEKYDILMGRYNYPLKIEVVGKSRPNALSWEGLGNGWAVASINHIEPVPKVLTNPDGLVVAFGSSDIKALMSYYYSFHHSEGQSRQMGLRCESNEWSEAGAECEDDLNAGDFHIILANKVGRSKQSLVMDIDRFSEVWNHPVMGYESKVISERGPGRNTPTGVAKVVIVKTIVSFVGKGRHSWGQTSSETIIYRSYSYDLFLDKGGKVMGGTWRSVDRPDFLWIRPGASSFKGQFTGLNELVK